MDYTGVRFIGRFTEAIKTITQNIYCASQIEGSIDFYKDNPYSMPQSTDEYVNHYIEFNSTQNGWHYAWQSSKHTNDVKHVFEIMILIPTFYYESSSEGTRCFKDCENLRLIKSFQSPEFNIVCSKRNKAGVGETSPKSLDVESKNLLFERKRSGEESDLVQSTQQPLKRVASYPQLHHRPHASNPPNLYVTFGDTTQSLLIHKPQFINAHSLMPSSLCCQTHVQSASSKGELHIHKGSLPTEAKVEPHSNDITEHQSEKVIEKGFASSLSVLLEAVDLMNEKVHTSGVENSEDDDVISCSTDTTCTSEVESKSSFTYYFRSSDGVTYVTPVSNLRSSCGFDTLTIDAELIQVPYKRPVLPYRNPFNSFHSYRYAAPNNYMFNKGYAKVALMSHHLNQDQMYCSLESGRVRQKYPTMA